MMRVTYYSINTEILMMTCFAQKPAVIATSLHVCSILDFYYIYLVSLAVVFVQIAMINQY